MIAATYNTDFAEDRIGRPTRDILERHGQRYFGVKIDQRSRSMKRWNTTVGGGLVAAGVERPVAGRPADFFVIDDPYPGIAEAMNPKFRADVWQWFQVNIISRRKPVMRMIAIMSRWHEDDFIAQLVRHARALTPAVAALARIARAIRNVAPSPPADRSDAPQSSPETTAEKAAFACNLRPHRGSSRACADEHTNGCS